MRMDRAPAPVFNTGIYLLRASQGGRKLMAAWLAERSAKESTQMALNRLIRTQHELHPATPSPLHRDLLLVLDGRVALGSLRVSGFENSYTYMVSKLHEVGAPLLSFQRPGWWYMQPAPRLACWLPRACPAQPAAAYWLA
jgi:hypothetical protein